MTQEVDQAVPAADEQVQNGAETPASEAAAQGEQQAQQTEVQSQEQEQPKRTPWFERRIDELTKARREAERERDALRSMIEQRSSPQQPTQQQQVDPYQLADQIATVRHLNERADEVAAKGREAFPDFPEAVSQINAVADLSERRDFLEAVTSLPNAHEVFYHLGKNPDDAAHVLSLSPVKMAMELATLAAKVGRPKPTSKAPAPITPVGKSAAPSADLTDDLPTDEWIARREAQLAKRRG